MMSSWEKSAESYPPVLQLGYTDFLDLIDYGSEFIARALLGVNADSVVITVSRKDVNIYMNAILSIHICMDNIGFM